MPTAPLAPRPDGARARYSAPSLEVIGLVSRLTMGSGGSSLDGNCTMTQRGGGNNPQPDGGPDSCTAPGQGRN